MPGIRGILDDIETDVLVDIGLMALSPAVDVQLPERLVVRIGPGQIDVRGRDEPEFMGCRRLR